MDVVGITQALHTKINATLSTQEVLIISKAIEQLKLGMVKTVATYADLSNQYPVLGDIFYVENEGRLYYSFGDFWLPIYNPSANDLYSNGLNTAGRLGDNSTTNKSSPVSVVGGFTDWIEADSLVSSIGLRANGTIWMWGSNTSGALGDGTTVSRSSPVKVLGGFADWIQVGAGNLHNVGLRANGSIWSWGAATNGRLGDNTTVSKSSPVSVVGGINDWVEVSAGSTCTIARRADGTVWSWGNNLAGRLGDGTVVDRSSPVSVVGSLVYTQISAGAGHALAIRNNGTLWAWGTGTSGRLGNNAAADQSSPVSVVGGFTDWTQVSAGGISSLGIRGSGILYAWGYNNFGTLGNNSTVNTSSPVSVIGGFTDWTNINAGVNASRAVRANGTLWAWGANINGRLGDNTTTNRSSPVLVSGGLTGWISAAGYDNPLLIRIR